MKPARRLMSRIRNFSLFSLRDLVVSAGPVILLIAALCAEASGDDVVLDTVSDVESLTSDLSATIWRKISLLP